MIKKSKGIVVFIAIIAIIGTIALIIGKTTAHYPQLAEPVSYSVNQLDGFQMKIEESYWSLKKGYCISYRVVMDSEERYTLVEKGGKPHEYLERFVNQQWYRFTYDEESFVLEDSREIGGENIHGYEAGFYQKDNGYGTRLETGIYRVVLALTDEEGDIQYLSDEFEVK